jgi:NTE family protein
MPIDSVKTVTRRDPVLVDLALQGGGSHGAFTWGVLDRLLEEPWLEIDGISGTSAGAMNAAARADGYAKGGPSAARAALRNSGAASWRLLASALSSGDPSRQCTWPWISCRGWYRPIK